MIKFYKFSLLTTIATYFLILVGGVVRVTEAGLGCPDWPTCFGRWIPPTSLSQLPPDIDPDSFNIITAWTEYINRLSGMTVGLIIMTLALWAIFKFRDNKTILYPSIAAALLTAIQGWQGSVVVSSLLEPIVISVHMFLALIIVGLLIYVTVEAKYKASSVDSMKKLPKALFIWVKIVGLLTITQIILGTKIRGAIEVLAKNSVDASFASWMTETGVYSFLHAGLGLLVVLLALYYGSILREARNILPASVNKANNIMIILFSTQLILGLLFIFHDLSAVRQLMHQWFGSLAFGVLLYLYFNLNKIGIPHEE